MMPVGAVFVPALAAGLLATAMPPVTVTGAPALDCPDAAAIERAIGRVRGADTPVGAETFALRVDRSGGTLQVDLLDPGGAPLLSRRLDAGLSDCGTAAEAVALIVERHFREIAWAPEPTAIVAATPAAAPAAAASVAPVAHAASVAPVASIAHAASVAPIAPAASVVSRAPSVSASPPAPAPLPPRLAARLGPALWTRMSTPAVLLDVRARVLRERPFFAGAGLLLPPLQSTSNLAATGGQAKLTAVPIVGVLGAERGLGRRWTLHADLEALLTFERGEAQGIAAPATAWRAVLALGAGAGAAVAVSDRARVTVHFAGYRAALGPSYAVNGLPGTVLEPPRWQALLGLGVEWIFIP